MVTRRILARPRSRVNTHQSTPQRRIADVGTWSTCGHEAGDTLLKSVGERLKRVVRAEDTVARLGGDEFALLVGDVKAPGSMPRIIERIRDSLSSPVVIASHEIAIGCCAGCARFPDDGTDLAALLKAADRRLYLEKPRPPGG